MNQEPQIYASDILVDGGTSYNLFRVFAYLHRDSDGRPDSIAYYMSRAPEDLDVNKSKEDLVVGLEPFFFSFVRDFESSAADKGDDSVQVFYTKVSTGVGTLYFEFFDNGEIIAMLHGEDGVPLYGYFDRKIVEIGGPQFRLSLRSNPSGYFVAALVPVEPAMATYGQYTELTLEGTNHVGIILVLNALNEMDEVGIVMVVEGDAIQSVTLTLPDGSSIEC